MVNLICIEIFCITQVIYHTDVGRGKDTETEGNTSEALEGCVPSNDFFDKNLHVVNGHIMHRRMCT